MIYVDTELLWRYRLFDQLYRCLGRGSALIALPRLPLDESPRSNGMAGEEGYQSTMVTFLIESPSLRSTSRTQILVKWSSLTKSSLQVLWFLLKNISVRTERTTKKMLQSK